MPKPTKTQILDEIDAAEKQLTENNGSAWPGMSYEEGVSAALRWALGEAVDRPMDD